VRDTCGKTTVFTRIPYYVAERDVFRRPGDQESRLRKHTYTERTRDSQASVAAGNACPLKAECP
jgi:hypothetical protein